MNHYKARELMGPNHTKTGKFHYTVMNDGYIRSVGPCSPWTECSDCKNFGYGSVEQSKCTVCQGRGLVKKENPCLGHDTEAGAENHYREYLLDHISYSENGDWPKYKCEAKGCENHATRSATVGFHMSHYQLCERHSNRDTLKDLMVVGEFYSS